jgi:U6 snRNA-associated Sm-like protein LSm5
MRGNNEFVGTLKGFDDYVNLVLDDVIEIQYDSVGTKRMEKLESSILLNGNAVTFLVPGGAPEGM